MTKDARPMTEQQPVAWMYAPIKPLPNHDPYFVQQNRANMDPRYWIETPLYTRPTPTDSDMVAAKDAELAARDARIRVLEEAVEQIRQMAVAKHPTKAAIAKRAEEADRG